MVVVLVTFDGDDRYGLANLTRERERESEIIEWFTRAVDGQSRVDSIHSRLRLLKWMGQIIIKCTLDGESAELNWKIYWFYWDIICCRFKPIDEHEYKWAVMSGVSLRCTWDGGTEGCAGIYEYIYLSRWDERAKRRERESKRAKIYSRGNKLLSIDLIVWWWKVKLVTKYGMASHCTRFEWIENCGEEEAVVVVGR